MVLLYMVLHGSHQYTPFMLAYIPAPWILWVYFVLCNTWAVGLTTICDHYVILICYSFPKKKLPRLIGFTKGRSLNVSSSGSVFTSAICSKSSCALLPVILVILPLLCKGELSKTYGSAFSCGIIRMSATWSDRTVKSRIPVCCHSERSFLRSKAFFVKESMKKYEKMDACFHTSKLVFIV